MTNVTLNKHLLVGTRYVISYKTFESAVTFFLIRNRVLAKIKKTIILHTKWWKRLEIPGFI